MIFFLFLLCTSQNLKFLNSVQIAPPSKTAPGAACLPTLQLRLWTWDESRRASAFDLFSALRDISRWFCSCFQLLMNRRRQNRNPEINHPHKSYNYASIKRQHSNTFKENPFTLNCFTRPTSHVGPRQPTQQRRECTLRQTDNQDSLLSIKTHNIFHTFIGSQSLRAH